MSGMAKTSTPTIRPYRPADEAEVLGLLRTTLGEGPAGDRSPEFFRWKHLLNPFGGSLMLVAESQGRIVGFRSLMRWRLLIGDHAVSAVQAVDTATHPEHQGMGIFSRLTREAIDRLRGDVDLVFNTPNEKSLPGYLKLGWRVVGQVPVWVRVRSPMRFIAGVRSLQGEARPGRPKPLVRAETPEHALSDDAQLRVLIDEARVPGDRLATARDVEYLRWRYGSPPGMDYRAVRVERGGRLRGLAFFRVRPRGRLWESTVAELIVGDDDDHVRRELLRDVVRSADVDHATCSFPTGPRGAARSGFMRAPRGKTFVVRPIGDLPVPDVTRLDAWALSLGDVEVF